MNRIVALGLSVVALSWVQTTAFAAEGKVAEAVTGPDVTRAATYSRAAAPVADQANAMAAAALENSQFTAERPTRAESAALSANASDFRIDKVVSTLRSDRDGDGYHSEFRVRFDADVIAGEALVYARLYLRRAGEREWFQYHETEDFRISAQSGDDDYFITTTLDDGYATAEYDVLIDLYESGFAGIVATVGPQDTAALSRLPLEEAGLDVPIGLPGYNIRGVSTELLFDADRDGYHSRFRITFDPDADRDNLFVYARIWVRAPGSDWIEEHVTDDFRVDASGSADAYVLDAEWLNGYPTAYYDVQIDLHDSASNLLVASAGSERATLAQIPLEDRSRDQFVNTPPPDSGGSATSRESGGGALGPWSLAIGLLLGLLRRSSKRL